MAAFSDVGDVWANASNFSVSDLCKIAGFGIRIRNPFIMIRFDYGWILGRRPGESKGAFHFSIGQAIKPGGVARRSLSEISPPMWVFF